MSIEKQAVAALKWITLARVVVQSLSWLATLLVLRLVAPEDYGLVASVAVVTTFVASVAELGLGASIIQAPQLSEESVRKLTALTWLLGIGASAALLVLAPVTAWLFRDERLTALTAASGLQFAVGAFAVVPEALLARRLAFDRLALIEIASGCVSPIVIVTLALQGGGPWALIAGPLSGVLARALLANVASRTPLPLFHFSGLRAHLSFGSTLLFNRIVSQIVLQADLAIASRVLTKTEVGHYGVALQLATFPMQKLMSIVNQIVFPSVARLQDEKERIRRRVLQTLSVLALLTFPLMWGLSATAPEVVTALLGPSWRDASSVVACIAIAVPLRMFGLTLNSAALAIGGLRVDLINSISALAIYPTAFLVGVRWGIGGLAIAWAIAVPLHLAISAPRTAAMLGLSASQIARAVAGPLLAAAVMYGAVAAVRPGVADLPLWIQLCALIVSGVMSYGLAVLLLARAQLVTALALWGAIRT